MAIRKTTKGKNANYRPTKDNLKDHQLKQETILTQE